jgi:hypothetical protein
MFNLARDRRRIMIAQQHNGIMRRVQFHDLINDIDGVRAIADKIAQNDEAIHTLTLRLRQTGIQRFAIAVNIRQKPDAHESPAPLRQPSSYSPSPPATIWNKDSCASEGRWVVFELWEPTDLGADLLFSETKLIELLQIEPEFRACPEPMAQPQSSVCRHGALTIDDACDAIDGDIDLARQFSS